MSPQISNLDPAIKAQCVSVFASPGKWLNLETVVLTNNFKKISRSPWNILARLSRIFNRAKLESVSICKNIQKSFDAATIRTMTEAQKCQAINNLEIILLQKFQKTHDANRRENCTNTINEVLKLLRQK